MAKKKKYGFYFFPADWLTDKGLRCASLAARGLWMDLLALMDGLEPRGVLHDLHHAAKLQGMKGAVADAWVAAVTPAMADLESNGVFSRGSAMPGALPPNSIVSRRMYTEWLKHHRRSESGRLGAQKRWNHHSKADGKRHGKPYGKTMANPMANDIAQKAQVNDAAATTCIDPPDGKAMATGMPSLSLPLASTSSIDQISDLREPKATTPYQPEGNQSQSPDKGPTAVGDIGLVKHWVQYEPSTDTDAPARAQAYLAELVRVTNDHKFRLPGWQKKVIAIVQSKAGLAEFSYLMDRLQKDVNPRMAAARGNDVIEDPKRFAAAELSRIHNELGGA